jgi:hypothetical protein
VTERSAAPLGAPLLWAASIAAGATTGAALMYFPVLALGSLIALSGGGVALVIIGFRRVIPAVFLGSLGIALAGYAFLGRSFAYLGAPPVFIGELMLALAIAAALLSGSLVAVARSPVVWAIVALSVCGLLDTAPYLSTYGLDALRDAALWGYGAFAIAVAACVLRTGTVRSVTRSYGGWITLFAAWLPAALAIARYLGELVPDMPGTDLPLISMKPGDAGVHLAGAAAFVLAGLYNGSIEDERDRPRYPRMFWPLWALSVLFVAALNRGGFLAVMTALAIVGILEPVAIGRRLAAFAAVAVVAASLILMVSINLEDTSQLAAASEERAFSPRQVVENVISITGRESQARGNLTATREWRLDWWQSIVDYTVLGPYFWSGKGFGINLADDDGFQVAGPDEPPLRNPHNVSMTVLARMGVPGTVLWLLLNVCFAASLVRGFLRAKRAGELWWARVDLWILSYWSAFLVNASFDVFLEGPQGGIWFWCVIGIGAGALECQRNEVAGVPRRWIAA